MANTPTITGQSPTTGFTGASLASSLQANPNPLFAQLLPLSWKGVDLPYAWLRIRLSQDNAEHKYVEKDGADWEPTGRNPIEFSARIPFLNSVQPASNEKWPQGQLWPGQWRKFLTAIADKTPGTLIWPPLGLIKCVFGTYSEEMTATTQDGVWAEVTWFETFDSTNNLAEVLATLSPISAGIQAARDVDAAIPSLQLPGLPQFKPTFEQTMLQIQGVFDTASLVSAQVAGTINSLAYRANAVLDAINRTSTSPAMAVQSVQNGPARDAIDRLRSALIGVQKTLSTNGQKIGLFVPGNDTTLPMICVQTGAALADLITLNPALVQSAIVPSNTTVRYYLAS